MSNVRGTSVERRQQAAAPAVTDPVTAIKQVLLQYRGPIKNLLPDSYNPDRFTAMVANAYRQTEGLWKCDPQTVVFAALRCAQLALEPNDGYNLSYLIPYGGKAQFQLGYGGVMELARRAMPGIDFDGRAVFPNDEFDVNFGSDEPLRHRPALVAGKPRGGQAFAWYVLVSYPDGRKKVHVLDREGVEYHRRFSKQPDGKMWKDSYDAAALKSVVLDMKRWLPHSAELASAMNDDEKEFELVGEDLRHVGEAFHSPSAPGAIDAGTAEDAANTTADEADPGPDDKATK